MRGSKILWTTFEADGRVSVTSLFDDSLGHAPRGQHELPEGSFINEVREFLRILNPLPGIRISRNLAVLIIRKIGQFLNPPPPPLLCVTSFMDGP